MDVLAWFNIFFCGIPTGVYVFEMLVVVPAVNRAPTQLSAEIHRSLFKNLPDRFMPWCGITGGAAAIALLAIGHNVSSTAQVLYAIGIACWLSTFVILVGFSRPLDRTISDWAESAVPADRYPSARKRWDRLMYTRGPLGLCAFGLFIAAALN